MNNEQEKKEDIEEMHTIVENEENTTFFKPQEESNVVALSEIIKKHKESSVAEFLYKNLHLLGFENQQRVFNVFFRELMDNSLDAFMDTSLRAESSKPVIDITLRKDNKTNWWTLDWFDSGCGIPYKEVPKVVCKLLYGSKFESTQIARGQQGLGCSSLMLWSQKTTDNACTAFVKNINCDKIYGYNLKTNIKKNEPTIIKSYCYDVNEINNINLFDENQKERIRNTQHFTFLRFTFKGSYIKAGYHSPLYLLKIYRYLNPEVEITYKDYSSNTTIDYPAVKTEYIRPNLSVKKIPKYVQLGDLNNLKNEDLSLEEVIKENFEISEENLESTLKQCFLHKKRKYKSLNSALRQKLLKVMTKKTVLEKPHFIDTSVNEGIINVVTEFGNKHFDHVMTASSYPRYFAHGALFVNVYAFYGEKLSTSESVDSDSKIELIRVANDTPLIYGAHNCAIYKSVSEFNWNKLKIMHTKGQLPKGSMKLVVSVKATKIPYATESKDFISNDQIIRESITEALENIGNQLKKYRNKLKQHEGQKEKAYVLTRVLPEVLITMESLKTYCEKGYIPEDPLIRDKILNGFENRQVVMGIMNSITIFVDKNRDISVVFNNKDLKQKFCILNSKSETIFESDLPIIKQPKDQIVIPFAINLKKHILKDYSSLDYFLVESDLQDLIEEESSTVALIKDNENSEQS